MQLTRVSCARNEEGRARFASRLPRQFKIKTATCHNSFMSAIAVRDLRKVYDGKAAVDGLNLMVPRGSFFGFLGPNGAGKSTTIRMLTGLIPATSGSIELLGLPLPARELEIKQRIGLVPDESLLFDRLTGAEFLEFVGRMYNLPRLLAMQRANELLELFE